MERHNDRRTFLASTAFGGMLCGLGGLPCAGAVGDPPATHVARSAQTPANDARVPIASPNQPYYGGETRRAIENFRISGQRLPAPLIHALGLVKWAAAAANHHFGRLANPGAGVRRLQPSEIQALFAACREVADGKLDEHFPVDVYQTGSGTSSNMNANEVISNRAIELSGGDRFDKIRPKPIHPNDHVNLGQSSNDVFPTAIHVAVAGLIQRELIPALALCRNLLADKASQWKDVFKTGRTHLNDAVPMTLGQEMGGLARQFELTIERAHRAKAALCELAVGGTAIGTGINTHPEFGARVAAILARKTELPLAEAKNHFEANAQRDGLVECSGELKSIAVTLFNVANNLRWLASGPRCGLNEIEFKELQAGSSIMPGKVNPVMCESLMQAAARVMGNDQTIAFCGAAGGQFQLNVMMPVMACASIESVRLMAAAAKAFAELALKELKAHPDVCEARVEKSLSLATALVPRLGYKRAADIAKKAFDEGKTIREAARGSLSEEELRVLLDPRRMIEPK